MSNFSYLIKGDKCWLIFGGYRMKIRWSKRWIQPGSTVSIVPDIKLDKSSITFTNFVGTSTITATATPETYSGSLIWESSNTSIATVSQEGVVTPVKYTTIPASTSCVITCKSSIDPSAKATCTVTSNVIVPTSITLNKDSLSFTQLGVSETLTPTVAPETAITDVVWSTSDATVANVTNGVVLAVANGTATITCTSVYDGSVKATCSVTVSA